MYHVLFLKTENLTPDEMNTADSNGEVWLHTGVSGITKDLAIEEAKRQQAERGIPGGGCELIAVTDEQIAEWN